MFFVSDGQPIEIACPASLSWDKTSNLTVGTSAAGYTRASYFGGARILRTMSLAHGALAPAEQAKIDALTNLGFGTELGFIPTGAERANLLTPGASLLATIKGVIRRPGTTDLRGNFYPGGINSPESIRIAEQVPFAHPGETITLSVVGRGEYAFSVQWLTASGSLIRSSWVEATSEEGYTRSSAESVAPPDASYFRAYIKGDVAAPAITIGGVYPWQVGQVANSVVVDAANVKMLYAGDKTRAPFLGHGYTIMEVGDYV